MDAGTIIVSAPGKVILHGEHAVVYGKPAIASSLNLRTYLQLTSISDDLVTLALPKVKVNKSWNVQQLVDLAHQCPAHKTEDVVEQIKKAVGQSGAFTGCGESEGQSGAFTGCGESEGVPQGQSGAFTGCGESEGVPQEILDQAVITFLYMYIVLGREHSNFPALTVRVMSSLPVGAGLGSSASYNVCLSAALLVKHDQLTVPDFSEKFVWSDADLEKINDLAFQGETVMHGTPSGIDNSVATFGGAIKFQGGKVTKLKSMPNLRILLTSTCVPRSTKVLVAGVKHRYVRLPDVMTGIMDSIGNVSENCEQTYITMETDTQNYHQHFSTLEELVDINQHLLAAIGVSHVTLDKICQVTSQHGCHSKLTGAGGGGCAFTLLGQDVKCEVIENIKAELKKEQFECWETSIGGEGVTVHKEFPVELT